MQAGVKPEMPGKAIYIVYSETAVTAPVFSHRGYASQGGRMDVIASSMLAAKADPNPEFHAVLLGPPDPGKVLTVLEWSFTTEKQIIDEILKAFHGKSNQISLTSEHALERILHAERNIILLEESGTDIADLGDVICGNIVLLLGGHTGFPDRYYPILKKLAGYKVSIGPTSLQTYQAILYVAWRRNAVCNGAHPAAGKRSSHLRSP